MILGWVAVACIVLFCGTLGGGTASMSWGLLFAPTWPVAAILAIIFGIVGSRHAKQMEGLGRKDARTGLILGLLNVALALFVIIMLPQLGAAKPRAQRIKCASNLRQIGQGLIMYANDHGGQYPLKWEVIMPDYGLAPGIFVCPCSNDQDAAGPTTQALLADFAQPGRCSYVYLGAGRQSNAYADVILAYEKIEHHESAGANFLFNDGHVEWVVSDLAKKMIQELQAGQNPPPSWIAVPPATMNSR
jgi:prepilin-type processing-associated H-X9-DG protein